jgi:fructose transport system substrate-binding protein
VGQQSLRRGALVRPLAVLGSAAVIASGVAACGSDDGAGGSNGGGAKGDKVTIGLITKTESNPFFVKMREAAKETADKAGATLVTAAGKSQTDNAGQATAIENMVGRGAKGILITPSDPKAIVPAVQKARAAGVVVIALDSPTDPTTAADALFATDNLKAGELIGQYANAKVAGTKSSIALLDAGPGDKVSAQRHDGFLKGYGISDSDPQVAGAVDTLADQAKAQSAMESLLQKKPAIDLVYTINEPAAAGAYTAFSQNGKAKQATILSIDGGCEGVRNVKKGAIATTSMQFPRKMAEMGVAAILEYAKTGKKPSGYTDTGVELITDQPVDGVTSKDSAWGLRNCWG